MRITNNITTKQLVEFHYLFLFIIYSRIRDMFIFFQVVPKQLVEFHYFFFLFIIYSRIGAFSFPKHEHAMSYTLTPHHLFCLRFFYKLQTPFLFHIFCINMIQSTSQVFARKLTRIVTASARVVQVIKWTKESGYRSHGELTNLIN